MGETCFRQCDKSSLLRSLPYFFLMQSVTVLSAIQDDLAQPLHQLGGDTLGSGPHYSHSTAWLLSGSFIFSQLRRTRIHLWCSEMLIKGLYGLIPTCFASLTFGPAACVYSTGLNLREGGQVRKKVIKRLLVAC